MPVISTLGAMSSRGFGEFNQQATGKYIEDYFSTWLYTGNGSTQNINNGIGLADTAAWSATRLKDVSTYNLYSAKVDGNGNLYSVGYANNTTDLYISLIKYTSSGSIDWQRKLYQGSSNGQALAFDSSNNVYCIGYCNDGSTFYSILAKYNSSGTIQWQRKLTIANNAFGTNLVVSSSGDIYITGIFYNSVFIAKYNSSGTIQWQRTLTQNTSEGGGIAIDSSDNVYIAAKANDVTRNYALIAKYNASGVIQWQRKLYSNGTFARAIAVDSSNNIYVAGDYDSITKLFVAKYDSSGAIQWQRTISQNQTKGDGISVDSSGNIYVSGRVQPNGTKIVAFIAKYNSSGTIQWQRTLEYTTNAYGFNSFVTPSGDIYFATNYLDGASDSGALVKLKSDGSTSSGAAIYNLAAGTATEAAGAGTETAGTATEAAGTATEAAGTATDAAGSVISSLYSQAAVTGAGGLVWMKGRSGATDHALYDTVRGATFELISNSTAAQTTQSTGLTSFLASGFNIGSLAKINTSSATYASWTWRETPKFFDVVTYTGDGTAGRSINHNLGSSPGMIIFKRTDTTAQWPVWHRSLAANNILLLNTTDASTFSSGYVASVSSTTFTINVNVNASGGTYVAYLFAHDAGGFGLDGTQNVISCGSFTADGSGNASINLGYEPQFILTKRTDGSTGGLANWVIVDTMRGLGADAFSGGTLNANDSTAEIAGNSYPRITSTGFNITTPASQSFIYMAIRRGPMKVPTDATTVFSPSIYTGTVTSSVPNNRMLAATDVWFNSARNASGNTYVLDRLRGWNNLYTPSTAAEDTTYTWSQTNQTTLGPVSPTNWWGSSTSQVDYYFKRAPGFMDEVCYSGTGTTTQNVTHNLGVQPELIIYKSRTNAVNWIVHTPTLISQNKFLWLNSNAAADDNSVQGYTNSGTPTATLIRPGMTQLNMSGWTYVAYLFATCAGVSKVGTYTGTGATQTISCGFTGGARYVMIKRTDSTGNWWFWDTARGMVAGTDPRSAYNSSGAETNANWVYTTTGGFQIVTSDATINANGGTYLYLSIA